MFNLNYIVCAPDYDAIRNNGYTAYVSQPIDADDCALRMVRELKLAGIVDPQLHGASHFNPDHWLRMLADGDEELQWFFDRRLCPPVSAMKKTRALGAAYLPAKGAKGDPKVEVSSATHLVNLAVRSYQELFGATAISFCPPNHCWDDEVESYLAGAGVRLVQAAQFQYRTADAFSSGEYERNKTGTARPSGVWLLGRNLDFEPATREPDSQFREARALLARRIPLVINTHRVNYVGSIDGDRRGASLAWLDRLLSFLERDLPALRYLDSRDLAELCISKRCSSEWGAGVRRLSELVPVRDAVRDLCRATLDRTALESGSWDGSYQ